MACTYEESGFVGDYKGVVTIEVNAPPVDVFTTKRNALSYDSTAKADVTTQLQELSVDPRTALKAKRDQKQEVVLAIMFIPLYIINLN